MTRRVLVTGIGLVTPIGIGLEAFARGLREGADGVGPVTLFDASMFPTQVAAEVRDWRPADHVDDSKTLRRLDRFAQFALVAAELALRNAGVAAGGLDPDRTAVIVGSGIGGAATIQEQDAILREKGPGRVSPFLVPMVMANMAAAAIAIRRGFRGPIDASSTACASGAHALGRAFRLVRDGEADAAVAGGAEATVNPLPFAGFCAARAMSTRREEASCPFDRRRDGFVMGEGAGIFVLEAEEAARARGARARCAIVGYGASSDGHHVTSPPPDGAGALAAMRAALRDAGADVAAIDLVSAHATSTPGGDAAEAAALRALLGDRVGSVPVTATKSQVGHMIGAAGPVAAAAAAVAIEEGFIPPVLHYAEPDPEILLDVAPVARSARPRLALANAFGFGGTNASLVLAEATTR